MRPSIKPQTSQRWWTFAISCEVRVDAIGQSPSSLCRTVKVRPSASALESEVDSLVRCRSKRRCRWASSHIWSQNLPQLSQSSGYFGLFKNLAARARVSLIAMGRNACDVWWGLQSEAPAQRQSVTLVRAGGPGSLHLEMW